MSDTRSVSTAERKLAAMLLTLFVLTIVAWLAPNIIMAILPALTVLFSIMLVAGVLYFGFVTFTGRNPF